MPLIDGEAAFVEFARAVEPALRIALVAGHGVDRGREAANDALVYAWKHWDRVRKLDNPAGYLYRLAERSARRRRPSRQVGLENQDHRHPWVEPRLSSALLALSPRQRQVVVLIESYEWTQAEVADFLGIGLSSVQTHLERGLSRLRRELRAWDHG
jgi:RNA polymerase sigma-70 factor (ECF subfamily)